MGYIFGTDVSWPQGSYLPGSERFVFAGAVSLDGGNPFVQSTYVAQVDNARRAGKEVGHYAFNGRTNNLSPASFADFFVNNLHDYRPGDALVLDVESSEGGAYRAWTPGEAAQFRDRVQARVTTRMGVYGNCSDMGSPGWGSLHSAGTWLWIAWPGSESYLSSIGEWGSDWQIWQYDSSGGLDKNYAKQTLAALAGVSAAPKKPARRKTMTTLFHTTKTNVVGGPVDGWHLAGDGQGGAAWLDITDQKLATSLAVVHGNSSFLTHETAAVWKKLYTSGAPVTGVTATVDIDYTQLAAAIASAIPAAQIDVAPIVDAIKAPKTLS